MSQAGRRDAGGQVVGRGAGVGAAGRRRRPRQRQRLLVWTPRGAGGVRGQGLPARRRRQGRRLPGETCRSVPGDALAQRQAPGQGESRHGAEDRGGLLRIRRLVF